MARFLFAVPPFPGHVNPTLAIGAELLSRGHQVGWGSFDPSLAPRIPAGGDFLQLESFLTPAQEEWARKEIEKLRHQTVYGIDSLLFLYEKALLPMNRFMLAAIEQKLDEYHPDVLINDHQVFAGAVVALRCKLPYVSSVTAPAAIVAHPQLPMIYKWESEQVVKFQQEAGIAGDERLDCSRRLTLVYTSEAFFGYSGLPEYFHFIGPVLTARPERDIPFDWERFRAMPPHPVVLVSIGTSFAYSERQAFFEKVMEALGNEPLNVVMVSDPALFPACPDNFLICPLIPQLQLLNAVNVVVCHAGQNIVCEAISASLPLVTLPIAYDQSHVAGCVERSGAGIRLNFNRFKAPLLRDAVYRALNDETIHARVEAVRQSFLAAGGAKRGAELIEAATASVTARHHKN
ncbi:MAG: glycosyl transferase [Bacteroidales bacterium]|jgi:MGT family glycosyltransferase|nr:glycosyl transferase [Bacteroidales bacterium]